MEKRTSFTPGKPWLDTNGNRIHAHGGSIIQVGDTFYWYGENKEKSTRGSGIWHWGVRCYKSKDLYNWEDCGIIVPVNETDPNDPMYFDQYMDRPHIIYNEKTKKFVMWIKIMRREDMRSQYMLVLTSDDILGPYERVSAMHPLGMSSGDFDLVKDQKTGKAYIYFDRVHYDMICAELSDDYTEAVDCYSGHLKENGSPYVREAPAFMEKDGKMYLFTSATTGYLPNPTKCAVADTYHGSWTDIGTVHENDRENLSFRSQISSVFKVPNKDLYIALADRWIVGIPEDFPTNFFEIFASRCDKNLTPLVSDEEWARITRCNHPMVRDTSLADYVWLPIQFENGRPVIRWYDEWKLEDFE